MYYHIHKHYVNNEVMFKYLFNRKLWERKLAAKWIKSLWAVLTELYYVRFKTKSCVLRQWFRNCYGVCFIYSETVNLSIRKTDFSTLNTYNKFMDLIRFKPCWMPHYIYNKLILCTYTTECYSGGSIVLSCSATTDPI